MSKVFWATGKTLTEQFGMNRADQWFSLATAINEMEEQAKAPAIKLTR